MRLTSVELHGYRRFAEPTRIDLYGRLIAIVGPNEAGKSSILQALQWADTGGEVPLWDRTRRDGDKGGVELRKKLTRNGIPKDRIVTLGQGHESGLVLEDLVRREDYLWAVNEELRLRSEGAAEEIADADLSNVNRPTSVDAWCQAKGYEPPGRINVANHVLERRVGKSSVGPSRLAILVALDEAISAAISRDSP